MKKIANLFEKKRLLFTIIVMFWIEIVSEMYASFETWFFEHVWGGFGAPQSICQTDSGTHAEVIMFILYVVLAVLPLIIFLISFIKNKVAAVHIIIFYVCIAAAVALGIYFGMAQKAGPASLMCSIADKLNDKFVWLEKMY